MATSLAPPAASPSAPSAAPAAPVSSPSSPGSSNYDQIGAALSEEPVPSQDGEGEQPPVEEPAGEQAAEATEESPAETDPAAEAQTQPEEDNPYADQPETDQPAPQTIKDIIKTPFGQRLMAAHKIVQELAKPVDQGGIGMTPTVDQVRDFYSAYRDRVTMEHHLNSGDPANAEHFLGFVFNQQRGQNAQTMAANVAPTLAKANPEAYVAAATPFVSTYGQALWDRWAEAPGDGIGEPGSVKYALYQAAQTVQKDMGGNYRTLEELGLTAPAANGQAAAGKTPDPFAEERTRLAQERQQIETARAQDAQAYAQRWNGAVQGSIAQNVNAELERALVPLKDKLTPRNYERERNDLHTIVAKEVPTHNPHAWGLFQIRLAQARRTGSAEDIQAVASEYRKLAIPVIKAHHKQVIEEALSGIVPASEAKHAQLRQIDSKRTLTGGAGAAPAPNASQPIVKGPMETQNDYILRMIRS